MRRFFMGMATVGVMALLIGWPGAEAGAQVIVTSEPGLAIPDSGGIPSCTDTISFPANGHTIGSIRVGLRVDHSWQADVHAVLLPPGVTWPSATYSTSDISAAVAAGAIELISGAGGSYDDFGSGTSGGYVFLNLTAPGDPVHDPAGTAPAVQSAAGANGLSGTFVAQDPVALADVYGGDPGNFNGNGGDWTLVVIDATQLDTGTLVAWEIEYGLATPPPEPEILIMGGGPIPYGGTDDVGTLTNGVASTVSYQIANTGLGELFVTGVTTSGATNCQVNVVTAMPLSVASSSATVLELEVTPMSVGPFAFDLAIDNNDSNEDPFVLHVIGTAQAGAVPALNVTGVTALEATALDTPVSEEWVLSNTGGSNLTITEIALFGGDATDFALSGLPSLPLVLPPSGTVPISVSFTSVDGVDASAVVSFVSDSGGEAGSELDVNVTGTLVVPAPEIDVQRGSAIASGGTDDLGDRAVGLPIELTFVIENQGTLALTLPGAQPAGLGEPLNCAAVVLTQPEGTVAPGASTEVTVEVTPETTGAFVVSLTLHSDDEDESPYLITIAGNGVETAPPNLVVIGNTSFYVSDVHYMDSASWVLVNDGGAELTISEVLVSGADAYAFSVSGLSVPTTLAPGAQTSLNVYFIAEALGTSSATIRIVSNSGGVPGTTTDMPVIGHASKHEDPGCNCRSTPAGGLPLGLLLALALLLVRRRRGA